MSDIFWSSKAEADLEEIILALKVANPDAAARLLQRIGDRLQVLSSFPLSDQRVGNRGLRQLVIRGFPYLVLYRLAEAHIEVRAVVHGKRRKRT